MTKLMFLAVSVVAFAGCVDDGRDLQPAAGAPRNTNSICPAGKVLICHLPPGNPANVQEICVGASAVAAHLDNHGDGVGGCYGSCGRAGAECGISADCCDGLTCANEAVCVAAVRT